MIKNIFLFLTISFCTFLIASTTYACDPLGCLLGGYNQDTLILGEVVAAKQASQDIKIIFVFPQNRIQSLKAGDQIAVTDLQKAMNLINKENMPITVGKKYLMSLNKKDNFYVPAWEIHEVTGTTYTDAQLVKVESADDAALQIFINSGGTERDFYFDGEKAFLRSKDGEADKQIYPVIDQFKYSKTETMPIQKKEENTLWYAAGIGVLALIVGGIVLISRKKK